MPGTSPEGWPYILDTDHPIEYPAYSQSLATLMDSRWDTYETSGVLTASTGWADYGAPYAGLLVTRSGGMVTVEGLLKRTGTDQSISSTPITLATIPAGFRPVHDFTLPVMAWASGAYQSVRGVVAASTGTINLQALPTVTVATNNWVSVVVTYRGA